MYFIKRVHLKSLTKGFALSAFSLSGNCKNSHDFIVFLIIFSPVSSVKATIEVISGREGTFRVKCTSSGGKTFTMDVEGPGYSVEEQGQMRVEAVGEPQRIGNDTYSATTSIISGGCNGDTYQCTASNRAAPDQSHNLMLKGKWLDLNIRQWCCMSVYLCCSYLRCSDYLTKPDILHISESGVESAIRRSHSDWLCSTLQ